MSAVSLTPALLAVVMPEATTHLVYPWVPTDRARQVIGFRYQMRTCSVIESLKRDLKELLRAEHLGAEKMWPAATLERCSPNTLELLSFAHYTATKGIALHEAVELEMDVTAGSEGAAAHTRKLQEAAVARSARL